MFISFIQDLNKKIKYQIIVMVEFELEKKIVYFEKAGKVNTEETLKLAKERAEELGIKTILLASSSGYAAQKALEIFKNANFKLVVVSLEKKRFPSELRKILEDKGIPLRFSALYYDRSSAPSNDLIKYSYPELMRYALYKLSEGMKVVLELGMVAAEEDLVSENEEVVAIAGTGHKGGRYPAGGGADTAVVMVPRRSENFNKLPENKDDRREIKEIICKPR